MKSTTRLTMVLAAALLTGAATPAFAEADIANGQKIFETRCDTCHSLEPGKRMTGPSLHGVGNRAAGQAENFPRYSKILQASADAGLTWTPENMAAYVQDPQGFLEKFASDAGVSAGGRTSMTYRLRDEKGAADVAAYLISLSQ